MQDENYRDLRQSSSNNLSKLTLDLCFDVRFSKFIENVLFHYWLKKLLCSKFASSHARSFVPTCSWVIFGQPFCAVHIYDEVRSNLDFFIFSVLLRRNVDSREIGLAFTQTLTSQSNKQTRVFIGRYISKFYRCGQQLKSLESSMLDSFKYFQFNHSEYFPS